MNTCKFGLTLRTMLLVVMLMTLGSSEALGQGASAPAASPQATPEPPTLAFSAAPAGEPDLSPFRLEIPAGETVETTMAVGNAGEAPVELRSYAADVATAVNGGYLVVPAGSGTQEESGWIAVPADSYVLDPGEDIGLKVEVSVPAGTPSGEYIAALATETVESAPIEGSGSFRQITRKINAVVITVPGPIEASFELGTPAIVLSPDTTTVIVPIDNTGNTRVQPHGTITIADDSGDQVAEIPVTLKPVYAWSATTIQYVLSPALPEGKYVVAVELIDGASGVTAKLPAITVTVTQPDDAAATPAS